jgi:arylsulfatase A-like enzyme
VALALGVLAALLGAPGQGRAHEAVAQDAPTRPNVVVVMADDMRVDDLAFAPNLRRLIAEHGVTFENSFSPFPLCCPARASLLTGQYAHNHRVWWHDPPFGYGSFDDSRTLATSLRAAGYRTGFVGKYLNRYGRDRSKVSGKPSHTYVPRGWTDWRAAIENPGNRGFHGSTYNYNDTPFNMNGRVVNSFRGRYQSNVIGDLSVGMAQRFARSGDPFFMYVNYVAPHHGGPRESDDPYVVRAGGSREYIPTPARPAWVKGRFDGRIRRASGIAKSGEAVERDRRDKPAVVRAKTRNLSPAMRKALLEATRQRAESIYVMDRHIARLVRELKRSGEWSNTVFVFTSDNGMIIGEHGMPLTKVRAYEPSLRVPMLVTGPGLREPQKRYDPMSTVDLAATILDVADAPAPRVADGISRWPSLTTGDGGWTTPVVTEAVFTSGGRHPAFKDRRSSIGIRTSRYSFTRYRNGEAELYDLVRDPRQDRNVYRAAAYATVRQALNAVWMRAKDCDGAECRVRLPAVLRADRATNAANTRTYWTKIERGYSW